MPVERRPECAIGQRPGFRRFAGRPPQLRTGAGRVDDQIETRDPASAGGDQRRPFPCRVDRFQVDPGLDGDPGRQHGAQQHAEQRGAMHGKPEAAALLRVVADIEHGAAAGRVGAMQPVDAAAQCDDVGEQPEIVEHRQAGRLQDETGTNRRRRLEPLEDGDAVPGPPEIERRRQPGRTGAGNRDIENSACHSALPQPARPSASGAAKSSRGDTRGVGRKGEPDRFATTAAMLSWTETTREPLNDHSRRTAGTRRRSPSIGRR